MKKTEKISTEITQAKRNDASLENDKGLLKGPLIKTLMEQLSSEWKLKEDQSLERSFKFPDFKKALDFTNEVGRLAEKQQHHPDVFLTYGQVKLQLSTHSAGGLTKNDFMLAAEIDELDQP